MSLTPAARFTLGNFKYDAHAAGVEVTLTLLPGVNSFRITLPAAAQLDAAPGEEASLELDGGEGAETVMTGTIRSLHRGLLQNEVVGIDGGALLAAYRPALTFEKQAAREVIRGLAQNAGVDLDAIDLDLPLASYVAHQRRTSAEHIAYLGNLAGALATFDGHGRLSVHAPSGTPALALLHGREIVEVETRRELPPVERVAIGSGPAGSAEAPDALRHTTDPLPKGAAQPGSDAVWHVNHVLRAPSAAAAAGMALTGLAGAQSHTISARCFLLPRVRPGTILEIQELPDELSRGPWVVTHVRHGLDPTTGGWTTFEGVSAGGSGLESLLGAAAGAIGGLL